MNSIATVSGDGMSIMERAVSASKSTIVPEMYQRNPDNCVIAINLADAMGLNVLTVMQNLYIVHKKPSWAAVFSISRWNTCGKFSAIRYQITGTPGKPGSSCVAYATDLATGEELRGTPITWDMVTGEEWTKSSKWRNMPEQMFRYRAASFLIKVYAPELLMGLPFSDEHEDAATKQAPKGRTPLAELRNVESQVVETKPVAIEQKQPSEHALHVYSKCMTALERATKQEHLDWVDKHATEEVTNEWDEEQFAAFSDRRQKVAKAIEEPQTVDVSFAGLLRRIAPMSALEANAEIGKVDSGAFSRDEMRQLDNVMRDKEAKEGKL